MPIAVPAVATIGLDLAEPPRPHAIPAGKAQVIAGHSEIRLR
jgi:hypothetical protein